MKNFKLVKTTAALALGASVVTAAVVPAATSASAASKYKVSNGKLVNAKTGKVVKGYVVFKSKLYYNGKLKKGYKTVGSGKTIKLYYNGSLKKGYKTANNKKLLFFNGSLKKGYKTAGEGERLYKDGYLDKGYEVYGDIDKNPSLYYNGYLKSGYKTANNATLLFYNGKLKEGYKTAKEGTVLYKDGRLNKGLALVEEKLYKDSSLNKGLALFEDKLYKDSSLNKGLALFEDKLYKDSSLNEGLALFEDKLYKGSSLNEGLVLFEGKLYKDSSLNKGLEKYEEKFYFDADLADGTYEYEGKEIAVEKGIEVGAKVKSVEAINGAQIKVAFNKSIDEDTVSSSTIKVEGVDSASVGTLSYKLSDDKKSVTISSTTAFAGEYTVKVTDSVKTVAEEKVTPLTKVVKVEDKTAPEVAQTTAVAKESTKTLKVKFNEPLKENSSVIAYVNGEAATATVSGDTVTLTAATAIKAGETATIKLTNVQDLAGNYTATNPLETSVTVTSDTLAPAIEKVETKGTNTIKVTYGEEVAKTSTTAVPYLSINGTKVASLDARVSSDDAKVVTYTVASSDAAAFARLFKDDKLSADLYVPAGAVEDAQGNASAAFSSSVAFTADTTAPTLSSLVFNNKNKIVATFSEDVTVTADSTVTLINQSTGATTAITLTDANTSVKGNVVTIEPGTLADGTYSVRLANATVVDASNNKFAAVTTTLAVKNTVDAAKDTTKPVVTLEDQTRDLTIKPGEEQVLTYTATDETGLDLSTILNLNNYTFNGKALPQSSYVTTTGAVTATNGNVTSVTVKVHVLSANVSKTETKSFTVNGIKDLAGNAIASVSSANVTLLDGVAPVLKSASLVSNTLVLAYSEDVDPSTQDLVLKINGKDVAIPAGASLSEGNGSDEGKYLLDLSGLVQTKAAVPAQPAVVAKAAGFYADGVEAAYDIQLGDTVTRGEQTIEVDEDYTPQAGDIVNANDKNYTYAVAVEAQPAVEAQDAYQYIIVDGNEVVLSTGRLATSTAVKSIELSTKKDAAHALTTVDGNGNALVQGTSFQVK
ncbi:hypothetical protein [Rummeliibacillus stabekisii]|uniref:hypothetical protein n=1 Tax=Rummeliibacillus stabekisii TaxID=241244 RepID=UPI003714A8E9